MDEWTILPTPHTFPFLTQRWCFTFLLKEDVAEPPLSRGLYEERAPFSLSPEEKAWAR